MVDQSFTKSLEVFDERKFSKILQNEIVHLRAYVGKVDVLYTPNQGKNIYLSFTLKVNFPTGGAVNNIPLHNEEPVFLLINFNNYPYKAPLAFSNRKDFPASLLPHLNPVPKNYPANFCLHRGDINEWFAEHTLVDFVIRLKSWLNDAVADKLVRNRDEFEVTRINNPEGYIIFDQDKFLKEIELGHSSTAGTAGYFFNWCELLLDSKDDISVEAKSVNYKFIRRVYDDNDIAELKELFIKINDLAKEENKFKRQVFGITVFPSKDKIIKQYFGNLPDKIDSLISWCSELDIPITEALNEYIDKYLDHGFGIPISVVIPRPQKVIRHRSNIEIINFLALKIHKDDHNIDKDLSVKLLVHRYPLTFNIAQEISGHNEINHGQLTLIGCGALGSKIGLHIARGGVKNIHFIDHDNLSPHNLVRNGLLGDSVGKNKAVELAIQINKIFYSEENKKTATHEKKSVIDLVSENPAYLTTYDTIIDATASNNALNALLDADIKNSCSIFRCEIAKDGEFGFVFTEGRNRNPRVDDILIDLYDTSLERKDISNWLKQHRTQQKKLNSHNEDIAIGIGCNSDTIILSDEIISFHAATMTAYINFSTVQF